jgi:hypothetical protein
LSLESRSYGATRILTGLAFDGRPGLFDAS